MAGLGLIATTPAVVALSAATVRTALRIVAPTNQRLVLKQWGVYFDGASATAVPVVVRLLRQTTAGTSSAVTLVKQNPSNPETIQATAQHSFTSTEPTASDVVEIKEVHPQTGYESPAYSDEDAPQVPGGTRLAIDCNAPATVNVHAWMRFEE